MLTLTRAAIRPNVLVARARLPQAVQLRAFSAPSVSNVFVGNIAWAANQDDLKEHFSSIGPVASVKIVTDRDTGRSRGFAFVNFADPASAQAALSLDGTEFMGRTIHVGLGKNDFNRRPPVNVANE